MLHMCGSMWDYYGNVATDISPYICLKVVFGSFSIKCKSTTQTRQSTFFSIQFQWSLKSCQFVCFSSSFFCSSLHWPTTAITLLLNPKHMPFRLYLIPRCTSLENVRKGWTGNWTRYGESRRGGDLVLENRFFITTQTVRSLLLILRKFFLLAVAKRAKRTSFYFLTNGILIGVRKYIAFAWHM